MNRNIVIQGVNIPSRFFLAPMAGYTIMSSEDYQEDSEQDYL